MSHRRSHRPQTRSYSNNTRRLKEQKSYVDDPRYEPYLKPVAEAQPTEAVYCALRFWAPIPDRSRCSIYDANTHVTQNGICEGTCGWEQYIRQERK